MMIVVDKIESWVASLWGALRYGLLWAFLGFWLWSWGASWRGDEWRVALGALPGCLAWGTLVPPGGWFLVGGGLGMVQALCRRTLFQAASKRRRTVRLVQIALPGGLLPAVLTWWTFGGSWVGAGPAALVLLASALAAGAVGPWEGGERLWGRVRDGRHRAARVLAGVGVAVLLVGTPAKLLRALLRAEAVTTQTSQAASPDGVYVATLFNDDTGAVGNSSFVLVAPQRGLAPLFTTPVAEGPIGMEGPLHWDGARTLVLPDNMGGDRRWLDVRLHYRP